MFSRWRQLEGKYLYKYDFYCSTESLKNERAVHSLTIKYLFNFVSLNVSHSICSKMTLTHRTQAPKLSKSFWNNVHASGLNQHNRKTFTVQRHNGLPVNHLQTALRGGHVKNVALQVTKQFVGVTFECNNTAWRVTKVMPQTEWRSGAGAAQRAIARQFAALLSLQFSGPFVKWAVPSSQNN